MAQSREEKNAEKMRRQSAREKFLTRYGGEIRGLHPSSRFSSVPDASGPASAERIRAAYPPPVPGVTAVEGAPFAMQPPQYPETPVTPYHPVREAPQVQANSVTSLNSRPDAAERIRAAYPPPVPGVAAAEGAPFAMQPPQYPERNFDAPRAPLDYLPGASAEQPPIAAVPSPVGGKTLQQAAQLLGGQFDTYTNPRTGEPLPPMPEDTGLGYGTRSDPNAPLLSTPTPEKVQQNMGEAAQRLNLPNRPPAETTPVEARQGTYSAPLDTSPAGPFMTVNPQDPGEQVTFGGATPFFTHGSRDLGDGQLPSNKFETVYTDAQGNPVATFTGPSQRQGTGGFVGAATDAEAARSRAAKRVQDQNASEEVARINRQIDSERSLRATKLGISRDLLARLENRTDDDIRQTMSVQDQYQSLVAEARDHRNSPQQRMQYAFAAEQLQPQLEQQADLQGRRMQEQGLDRRAQLAADAQLAVTEVAQVGQNQRAGHKAETEAQKRAEERRFSGLSAGMEFLKTMGVPDEERVQVGEFIVRRLPEIADMMGYNADDVSRLREMPTEKEMSDMLALSREFARNSTRWSWRRETPEQILKRMGMHVEPKKKPSPQPNSATGN